MDFNLARSPQVRGDVLSVDIKGCVEKASALPFLYSPPHPSFLPNLKRKQNYFFKLY